MKKFKIRIKKEYYDIMYNQNYICLNDVRKSEISGLIVPLLGWQNSTYNLFDRMTLTTKEKYPQIVRVL